MAAMAYNVTARLVQKLGGRNGNSGSIDDAALLDIDKQHHVPAGLNGLTATRLASKQRCASMQVAFLVMSTLLGSMSLLTLVLVGGGTSQSLLDSPDGDVVLTRPAPMVSTVVHGVATTTWGDVPTGCLAWTAAPDITLHLTRELHPMASYGGYGRVVGGMLQRGDSTYALLPAYDFLLDNAAATPVLCGTFAPAHALPVRVWYLQTAGVRAFLLDPPSNGKTDPLNVWSTLWHVGNSSQIYTDRAGFTQNDRDIWYGGAVTTFVTAFLHGYHQAHDVDAYGQPFPTSVLPCTSWGCVTVHAHGSIHSAALWFLRGALPLHRRPTMLFTLHDYHGDLWRIFSVSALVEGPVRTLARRACILRGVASLSSDELGDTSQPSQLLACFPSAGAREHRVWASPKRATMLFGTALGLHLSDAATTVSLGMLRAIMNITDMLPLDMSEALRDVYAAQRIFPVSNAVTDEGAPFMGMLNAVMKSTSPSASRPQATAFRDWPRSPVQLSTCAHVHDKTPFRWSSMSGKAAASLRGIARSIADRKRDAKVLVARDLFDASWVPSRDKPTGKDSALEEHEPLVIAAVGRLERNKGFLALPKMLQTLCAGRAASEGNLRPLLIAVIGHATAVASEFDSLHAALGDLYGLDGMMQLEATAGAVRAQSCRVRVVLGPAERARWLHTVQLAADIVLVPSSREAFGLVVAEALGHAAIPVATAVGGITDMITPEPRVFTALMRTCFSDDLHGGDGCDPNALQLMADLVRTVPPVQVAWNGYLVPVVSHAPNVVAVAFVEALRAAIADLEAVSTQVRHDQLVSLVATTPQWDAPNAAYECLIRAVTYARHLGGRASTGSPAVPPVGNVVHRYGPQLLPRLHVERRILGKMSQSSLVGWSPSVRGYTPETLSIGSDALARIARMSLPRSGEKDPAAGEPRRAGLQTDIVFPGGTRAAVVVSAYSSGLHVELGAPEDYCVYVDAYYNDGTSKYGLISDYGAGSHAWTTRSIEVPSPPKNVPGRLLQRLTVAFLLRTGGEATISEPSVRLRVGVPPDA